MKYYYRAVAQTDVARPSGAKTLAGGWCWFTHVEILSRAQAPQVAAADTVPSDILRRLCAPRADVCQLSMATPRLMGILNVTPDSFSDGGTHQGVSAALRHAKTMVADGTDILDIGGESTRPGATLVPSDEEIARTAPAIQAISQTLETPISIDTRKARVAKAALEAGAHLINDVSGCRFDAEMPETVARANTPVCVMHAQGDPETMQHDPQYDDVLLDVYDDLEAQVAQLERAGVARENIVVDPGIGFGKTLAQNLALLARLSLFHSLGCPVLLGASRKKFIGTLGKTMLADERIAGSVAVALEGISQGVQIVRIHDVAQTRQALTLWQAVTTGEF